MLPKASFGQNETPTLEQTVSLSFMLLAVGLRGTFFFKCRLNEQNLHHVFDPSVRFLLAISQGKDTYCRPKGHGIHYLHV